MTIFGPDIYNGQAGLNLTSLRYASFVLAKTTEGTYYADKSYQSWRRQAQAANELFLWYHFLTRENVAAQIDNTRKNVGDLSLPGMLDAETAYGYTPTWQQILDYIDQAHAAGLNLRLLYLPHWVWEQMGSPNLTGLRSRNVYLVSSNYPGGAGTPPQIYPGDRYAGWAGYGGMPVTMAQFTDQGLDGSMRIDYNAFQGTVDEYRSLLYPTNTPTTGGPDVTYTVTDGWKSAYPEAAAALDHFAPVGTQMDAEQAASYAAMRSIVGVYYDQQINSKLDQVINTLANPAALGAAIASHLSAGGSTDEQALTQFIASHLKINLSEQ